jgi:hypothetical protein
MGWQHQRQPQVSPEGAAARCCCGCCRLLGKWTGTGVCSITRQDLLAAVSATAEAALGLLLGEQHQAGSPVHPAAGLC